MVLRRYQRTRNQPLATSDDWQARAYYATEPLQHKHSENICPLDRIRQLLNVAVQIGGEHSSECVDAVVVPQKPRHLGPARDSSTFGELDPLFDALPDDIAP